MSFVGGLTSEQWISEWRALGEHRQLRCITACASACGENSTVVHLLRSLSAPNEIARAERIQERLRAVLADLQPMKELGPIGIDQDDEDHLISYAQDGVGSALGYLDTWVARARGERR